MPEPECIHNKVWEKAGVKSLHKQSLNFLLLHNLNSCGFEMRLVSRSSLLTLVSMCKYESFKEKKQTNMKEAMFDGV